MPEPVRKAIAALRRRRELRQLSVWLPAIVISGILAAGALVFAGEAMSAQALRVLGSPWILAAFACLAANQAVGAARILVAGRIGASRETLRRATSINVVQQVTVRLLPLRLSEVVWVYLVTRGFALRPSAATGLLLHIRIWDVCVLLTIAALMLPALAAGSGSPLRLVLVGAALLLVAGMLVALLRSRRTFVLAAQAMQPLRAVRWTRAGRIALLRMLRTFVAAGDGAGGVQFGLALLGWAFGLGSLGFITAAIAVDLAPVEVVLALVVLLISSVVPLPALGVAGSGEIGYAAALTMMRVPAETAVAAALMLGVTHALLSLVLGGLWFGGLAAARLWTPGAVT